MTVDRTYLAVQRQVNAMKSEKFEIGILKKGQMNLKVYDKETLMKSVSYFKSQNKLGADIYVRPFNDNKNDGIILVDDLTKTQLERMKEKKLEPACVVETSPQNYQAWLRLSEKPIEPEIATKASKAIARYFEADPNSADWRHFGRLAGFTNQKKIHIDKNGRSPFVLAHESTGRTASRGSEMLFKAIQAVEKDKIEREEALTRMKESASINKTTFSGNVDEIAKNNYKQLSEKYKNLDESKADFMVVKSLLSKGADKQAIKLAVLNHSPNIQERKEGHIENYIDLTIKNAEEKLLFEPFQKEEMSVKSKGLEM